MAAKLLGKTETCPLREGPTLLRRITRSVPPLPTPRVAEARGDGAPQTQLDRRRAPRSVWDGQGACLALSGARATFANDNWSCSPYNQCTRVLLIVVRIDDSIGGKEF